MMSLDNTQPSREILDICNQLQANYDPKKTHWTVDELYKKIFAHIDKCFSQS